MLIIAVFGLFHRTQLHRRHHRHLIWRQSPTLVQTISLARMICRISISSGNSSWMSTLMGTLVYPEYEALIGCKRPTESINQPTLSCRHCKEFEKQTHRTCLCSTFLLTDESSLKACLSNLALSRLSETGENQDGGGI